MSAQKKLIQISEAAEVLGVSIDTIRRWDKAGILHSSRPDGKNRFFSLKELEDLKFSKPFTISEASEKLKLSPSTLRRLDSKKILKSERNRAGERVYSQKVIESFLNSSYFLRKKMVQEEILAPFKEKKDELLTPKEHIKKEALSDKVLAMEVDKLNNFKNAFYTSGIFLATFFILIIFVITVLFLVAPEKTASFLSYRTVNKNELSATENYKPLVLGASTTGFSSFATKITAGFLKPFSAISLKIVKVVSTVTYKNVVPIEPITDINQVLKLDENGNIVPLAAIKLPDVNYLQVSQDHTSTDIVNVIQQVQLASVSAQLEQVFVDSSNIIDGSVLGKDIAEGTITASKLAGDIVTGVS